MMKGVGAKIVINLSALFVICETIVGKDTQKALLQNTSFEK